MENKEFNKMNINLIREQLDLLEKKREEGPTNGYNKFNEEIKEIRREIRFRLRDA